MYGQAQPRCGLLEDVENVGAPWCAVRLRLSATLSLPIEHSVQHWQRQSPLVLGPNIGDSGSSRFVCGVFVTACSSPGFATNFISGSATPITTAPEPASLLLVGTGLLGVAGIKRRRSGR